MTQSIKSFFVLLSIATASPISACRPASISDSAVLTAQPSSSIHAGTNSARIKRVQSVLNGAQGSCGVKGALRRAVVAQPDISPTEVHFAAYQLTTPKSGACNKQSCDGQFGVQGHEWPAVLKRTGDELSRSAGAQGRELAASVVRNPTGGQWRSGTFTGETIPEDGYVYVFSYQKGHELEDLFGISPDSLSPVEQQAAWEQFAHYKMMHGADGNAQATGGSNISERSRIGYGLYVATDPWQSDEYGEYMLVFKIPKNAPYLLDDKSARMAQISSDAYGIIYNYSKSRSGRKAAVLRYKGAVHPKGTPVIPGSVRVYKKHFVKFERSIPGALWDPPPPKLAEGDTDPVTKFLDENFHRLDFFTKEKAQSLSFNMTGNLTRTQIAGALEQELRNLRYGSLEAVDRLQDVLQDTEIKGYGAIYKNFKDRPLSLDTKYHIIEDFIDRLGLGEGVLSMKHGARGIGILENSLFFDTKLAQILRLVPEHFQPKSYDELEKKIFEVWATPARRDVITKAIRDYNAYLAYLKKNNLDYFADHAKLRH
jgi:hypothetical protein